MNRLPVFERQRSGYGLGTRFVLAQDMQIAAFPVTLNDRIQYHFVIYFHPLNLTIVCDVYAKFEPVLVVMRFRSNLSLSGIF